MARTGVEFLVDVVAGDDEEGRSRRSAVSDAGPDQGVTLKSEDVDLIPDACRQGMHGTGAV